VDPSGSVASRNSISLDSAGARAFEREGPVARPGQIRALPGVSDLFPAGRTNMRSQDFKELHVVCCAGNLQRIEPQCPDRSFKSSTHRRRARTRISSPRSLSKITCVTPRRASRATRKPMNTVLPEPVGPHMKVWPGVLPATRRPDPTDRSRAARSNTASERSCTAGERVAPVIASCAAHG